MSATEMIGIKKAGGAGILEKGLTVMTGGESILPVGKKAVEETAGILIIKEGFLVIKTGNHLPVNGHGALLNLPKIASAIPDVGCIDTVASLKGGKFLVGISGFLGSDTIKACMRIGRGMASEKMATGLFPLHNDNEKVRYHIFSPSGSLIIALPESYRFARVVPGSEDVVIFHDNSTLRGLKGIKAIKLQDLEHGNYCAAKRLHIINPAFMDRVQSVVTRNRVLITDHNGKGLYLTFHKTEDINKISQEVALTEVETPYFGGGEIAQALIVDRDRVFAKLGAHRMGVAPFSGAPFSHLL